MRLDKLLCDLDVGTRSEVKQYIRQGRVTVNGLIQKDAGFKVDPDSQTVCCFGKEVRYQKYVYYMLYKPQGCVTARMDGRHKTVMDYIEDNRRDLSPVGRLDLDTEGLLLITNDGSLSHELLSPAKHVRKVYEARLDGPVTEEDTAAFETGIEIGDDTPTRPAKLIIRETADNGSVVHVSITEGRYHQIKRMFAARGRKVTYLKRIEMGSLKLDEALVPGEYRILTEQEIDALKMGE